MQWGIVAAVIISFVEALTEFAPVSSTGHMIIVNDLILHTERMLTEPVSNTFLIVVQLGSVLAVVVVFKQRFKQILQVTKKNNKREHTFSLNTLFIGIFPAIVTGFLVQYWVDTYLFSIHSVILALIAGSVLMIIADTCKPLHAGVKSVDQITYKQAFIIGLFQSVALWPGFSRSGATISGGVLLGLSHRAAADFTFIMAVPIMAGASGLSLLKNLDLFTLNVLPFFAFGFVGAFVFSLLVIRFFLNLINTIKLFPFAIYRILLAGVLLVWI
ncbi:undecaprenyl-diphosphate phosphatase [Halobacillus salinarum]|uniref:Undecaprenyl-diphosphatase n=1 Tax=Halobacillus salinarum TaxID=2932257 RepID=A0ABY4ENC0_9BACI|nr:undecaprenyl-diphosphate phosphatase [Halobacillus salinarum]UOQ45955.1 undecaprenyl-diphosphate phosphatase [Halobacillus salinarum]